LEDTTTGEAIDDSSYTTADGTNLDVQNNVTNDLVRLASTGRIDTAVFSAAQFSVILSALRTDNNSKLVANPTVVTMNNQPATIKIVTEIPQVEFTFNAETGTREADGLAEPLVFGTEIEVTPQVNAAGFINLNVLPSVSNQIGLIDTEVGPQPIISRREAKTNVVIKDGFTLAIGGLSQNEETKSGTKVPILGGLPGIGRFFSSESNNVEQRNLIIFITAKTLNPDGSNYRDIIDPRMLKDMGVIPSDVPGYQLPQADLEALNRLEAIRQEARSSERVGEVRSQIEAFEKMKAEAAAEAATNARSN
jgi:type IV pilus assembly protein PilQ